ncbi:MAG: hypothetical protein ABI076_07075 [Acidobacteriaceae bacterium]
MSPFKESGLSAMLSVALLLGIAGCNGNQNAAQAQMQDQAYAPQATPVTYNQVAQDQSGYDPGYDQGDYDTADEQPVYAPEAPPEMPEYDQPEIPGDNYIWTPGYWYWSPAGYYWVPGAWVLAPYVGALWTPGYWGFVGNRYFWNAGYWGPYIGFYGGINYGYGYYGSGYEGGYWNGGAFYYNRSINRVGRNMRYVYTRNVSNNNRNRVSYNGGRGGLNARPNSSQVTAARSRRFGALPAQRQLVQQSRQNRGQFANTNKGRPAQGAWTRPVNGGRKAPAARPTEVRPSTGTRPAEGARHGNRPGTATRPNTENRPAPNFRRGAGENTPSPGRPSDMNRPSREQQQPTQQTRPAPQEYTRPTYQNRPESGNRPQQPSPQEYTRPTYQNRPEPGNRPQQPRPQARPEARPLLRQESRPDPQPRQQSRPAPQVMRESRPSPLVRSSPQQRPAPQARREQRSGDNRPN